MGSMPIEFARMELAPAALRDTLHDSGVYHRILQVRGGPAATASGAWCVGR